MIERGRLAYLATLGIMVLMSPAYDAIAWVYRRFWGPFSVQRFMPVLERWLLPRLPQGAAILDLGCGTGNLARALWARGYRVMGLDISARMLREARVVAPEVLFVQGDMRSFRFPGAFQAAIALFATINHIVNPADLPRVLRNVKENLVKGGWFLLDFNTPAGLRARWQGVEAVVEDDLVVISRGQYDEHAKIATSTITAFRPQGGLWVRRDTTITLRGYDEDAMRTALRATGFEVVAMHRQTGKAGQGRVLVLARRPGAVEAGIAAAAAPL